MDDPRDPRTHDCEPPHRSKIIGVTRGAEISVEIDDAVEQRDVVVTFPEAVIVVADKNLDVARVFAEMATNPD